MNPLEKALDSELATANERIRELEAWQETVRDASLLLKQRDDALAKLTAEREVSDKLVAALQRIAKLRIVEVDGILDDYIDVIAAALRKGQA